VTITARGPAAWPLWLALASSIGLGACQNAPASPADRAQQYAFQLCVAYLPPAQPRDGQPPVSPEQTCASLELATPGIGSIPAWKWRQLIDQWRAICSAALPDDPDYCRTYARERQAAIDLLSTRYDGSRGGAMPPRLEMAKACILLADRVFGTAPDVGYCLDRLDGLAGLVPPVQAGDVNAGFAPATLLQRHFPVGSELRAMIEWLTAAGFTCEPDGLEPQCSWDNSVIAFSQRRLRGVAGMTWRVRWRADPSGRLERVDVTVAGAGF
jgi:hypothetical protein